MFTIYQLVLRISQRPIHSAGELPTNRKYVITLAINGRFVWGVHKKPGELTYFRTGNHQGSMALTTNCPEDPDPCAVPSLAFDVLCRLILD